MKESIQNTEKLITIARAVISRGEENLRTNTIHDPKTFTFCLKKSLLKSLFYAHTKSIEFSKLPKVHVTFLVLVSMMKIESLDGEAMRFENKSENGE